MTTATRAGAEIMKLENLYRDALISGDKNTIARLSADPCLVAGAMGVREVSRKDLAAMMDESNYELRSYHVDEGSIRIRPLTEEVVSVAYRVSEEWEAGSKPGKGDAYNASMWVRNGGSWECAVHADAMAR